MPSFDDFRGFTLFESYSDLHRHGRVRVSGSTAILISKSVHQPDCMWDGSDYLQATAAQLPV